MDYRNNVCALIKNKDRFLIVKKKLYEEWGFVQGGIKKGEDEEEAVKREVREETGIKNIKILGKSKYTNKYDWPEKLQRELKYKGQLQSFFLIETSKNKVILSPELNKYKWIRLNELLKYIKYKEFGFLIPKFKEEFGMIQRDVGRLKV